MLIDLHAHTAPRSNCSRTTLEELVETARRRGLDALCITEHDVRWPDDELADASRLLGFPLIPGVELTTDVGHVLVFGPLRKPLWLGYRLDELVDECAHSDTALVLPHPLRRLAGERAIRGGRVPPKPETVAALPQWEAVHAIEVASTQTTALEHTLTAAALGVVPRPAVGASDAHAAGLAGTYATELDATVHTAEQLAAELRAGHVKPTRLG
jgi:predicted metal-dependent phosphoesterase TrpH